MENASLTAGVSSGPATKKAGVAQRNTTCRYCGSQEQKLFLSLGAQPPSNSFLRPEQVPFEKSFPLDVYWCQGCSLVQLLDVVPAESIFNDEYLYASSTSKALKQHYAGLAALLTSKQNLKAGDLVVDIGCNDGILLNGYTLPGLIRAGVEPSQLSETARRSGIDVVRAFFGRSAAEQIVAKHGMAKVVTATNVFAHVDNISDFVSALPPLIGHDGIFVIEAPYLVDMIDQGFFDTIYHEHLCYLSLTPLIPFMKRHGLEVFDIERVPFGASGPAIRVFIRTVRTATPIQESVTKLLRFEKEWGIDQFSTYKNYATKVEAIRSEIWTLIRKIKAEGKRLGGYGAPAKGNTLLNYLGLTANDIECIAETAELKQGCVTPGSHIPIVSEEAFVANRPDYALLLTWNYVDFFLQKSDYIRAGGRFLVPLPTPRIAP